MRLIKTKRTLTKNGFSRYHASTGHHRVYIDTDYELSPEENSRAVCEKLMAKIGWDKLEIVGSTYFNEQHFFIVDLKPLSRRES